MKYIKTYGINGLLEWHGVVESNGIKMKVSFTNGSMTANGVAPATFMTRDELTQHIMENSTLFKNGRIRLVSSSPIPGSEEPEPVVEVKTEDKAEDKAEAVTATGVEVVEVSDKAAAVAWLQEHHPEKGYTAAGLLKGKAFASACKECGVEFQFN